MLRGLKDDLLQPELIREFVTTYQQEYNRLRREQVNEHAAAQRSWPRSNGKFATSSRPMKAGLFAPAMKEEMADARGAQGALVEIDARSGRGAADAASRPR